MSLLDAMEKGRVDSGRVIVLLIRKHSKGRRGWPEEQGHQNENSLRFPHNPFAASPFADPVFPASRLTFLSGFRN